MGSTTNATQVYYDTAGSDDTLLEQQRQRRRELERRDGVRRHFEYPWWIVAEHNPLYRAYVEREIARLGPTHPTVLTQYCLQPVADRGRFFSAAQRDALASATGYEPSPQPAATYVAGEDEEAEDAVLRALEPRKDSTVCCLCRLERRSRRPQP